jgi:RHS repeat-associated protein
VTADDLSEQTYGYDSENRLVSVDGGSTASYAYDHQNRRYKKTVGSTVTHYVWQGYQVLAEHNGSTGAVLWDYVFVGSRMIGKVAGATVNYFLSDRLSVRLTMSSNGSVVGRQAHLPSGEDFAESGTQDKHHFTSYESDSETGTDYAVNRQYSQGLGRFNRPDPLSSSSKKQAPQSWNRYAYSVSDPINMKDPLGLFACWGCEGWNDPCSPNGPTVILDGFEVSADFLAILCGQVPAPIPAPDPDPGQQVPQCPVSPLSPITDPDAQRFENNPNTVDVANLTPAMQTAVTCFENAVRNAGGSFTITSAWRPAAYQQHLREVWDKHMALRNNNTAECANTRAAVAAEFNRHRLIPNQGARPAARSDHTRGLAIDARITGLPRGVDVDTLGAQCNLNRPVAGDPVHWVLIR